MMESREQHTSAPRKILVATDFSEPSADAITVAHDYARRDGAALHLLHVKRPGEAEPPEVRRLASEMGADVRLVSAVRVGTPAVEIVRYAEDHGIDLIVVGGHGRTGITDVLLGSVAERVARTAPCPVLLVPPTRRARGWKSPRGLARCVVCGTASEGLFCASCRGRLRLMGSTTPWIVPPDALTGDLSEEAMDRVLRGEILGRLGCCARGEIYVVPMAYAYEDGAIFLRSGDGMKIRILREAPDVCFQVDHISDMANWQSVIAWGTFRELHGHEAIEARERLLDRLSVWTRVGEGPSAAAGARDDTSEHHAIVGGRDAVVGRIEIARKTGRFVRC
jgi:nucleotide-binding universal stress UspA family protein/nitroimidazol reductase NimA-like FMN-containing flavoprotein (pyridoxamine 5'-phosphate oxidase superfamily)